MTRKSRHARPPTYFGFTDETNGTKVFDDVDSQQKQTGLTQPMQIFAEGKLEQLKSWWESLKELGPEYENFPNAC